MTTMVLRIGAQFRDEDDDRTWFHNQTGVPIQIRFAGQRAQAGGNVSENLLIPETSERIFISWGIL